MISDDTDTEDSEDGIRFKTTSTRNKDNFRKSQNNSRDDRERDRHRRFDKSCEVSGRVRNGYLPTERSASTRKTINHDEISLENSRNDISDDKDKSSKHKSKKSKHKKHRKEKPETKTKPSSSSEDSMIKIDSNQTTISSTINAGSDVPGVFGPSLPPSLYAATSKIDFKEASSSITQIEELNQNKQQKIFGPALPNKGIISPSLSTEDLSSDDEFDTVIGPLPDNSKQSQAHIELEKRALKLKMSALKDDTGDIQEGTIREEWMLELPQINSVANLGLVSRQFRVKDRPDFNNRNSWTETPQDKEGKNKEERTHKEEQKALAEDIKMKQISRRDDEQAEIAKKHKKKHKRDESLLEIHEKKLRKKKKKDEKNDKPTRRTFDRDTDLKLNNFNESQKKSIVKKAQLLDTRFSSGAAKYL